MPPTARLSVDIGGTFTDLVLLCDDGRIHSAKVSSTPAAPEEAMLTGMTRLLAAAGLEPGALTEVLHGTTVGSNTLLQKAGARSGLITTRGFRDVLEIGRLRTPGMFDLRWDKPEPLVARRHRLEATERVMADGTVLTPLVVSDVLAAGAFFRAEGVGAVALCFLNSYRNPVNERAAAEVFAETFSEIALTASVDVLPQAGEYERTSTTAVNAYVLPALRGYLDRLERKLRAAGVTAPLLVGNSNGELAASRVAREKPVFFISSGRASGAVGAERLGAATGEADLVAFDMGGTTASAALVHEGALARAQEYEFRAGMSVPSRFIKAGGYLMQVPTVDVAEVGSGAGSIAAIDAAGLLTVGPVSAGADPGPVCYGMGGTRPTVTDANAALGLLPPVLAGGTLALDIEAARRAIGEALAAPLGLTVEAAALGVRAVANATMMRAIRAVTVERGLDPRELTLLAFGGSGPVHACDLARMLGIGRVIFPPSPGVFTAMGMLAGSVAHHELRPAPGPLEGLDAGCVGALLGEMRAAAVAALGAQGYAAERVSFGQAIDLRLQGQDAALSLPFEAFDASALRPAFVAAYRALYGYAPTDAVEAVQIRLRAEVRPERALDFRALKVVAKAAPDPAGARRVHFERGPILTPVMPRSAVVGPLSGPVIIEGADTTIVVPPGVRIAPDATGSLVAILGGGGMSAIDPVTFAVIKAGLDTIVDDMAYAVMRTARSSIVRDVLDYSVTLCDRRGRILTQAKTVALHLGAVPDAMEAVLAEFGDDLAAGDVVIFNDPYQGGMHLPDIFMVKPIFAGERRAGFAVVIAHHCDVGGRVPGSNASDSTEIYQEGLRIAPMKLYSRGEANRTLLRIIERNVRLPAMVLGDLDAQLATCNIGERELLRLWERHGAALEGYFDRLLDYGEALTRKAIGAWPDGTWSFTDYIDGDGFSDAPIPIVCGLTVAGEQVTVDFAGSSPQVKGAINATLSFVKSATYLAVRCAMEADVPNNAGVYRCISVRAPEGSILNPRMPAPVAARALTGYRVVDAVLGALAQVAPGRLMAAGEGGNTVVAIGGYHGADRQPFVLVDMINGAWGGRDGKDGVEGITNPSQNMSNLPVETLEARYPLMVEEYALRPDSGGAGQFRGGLGLVRQYRLMAESAVLQLRADRVRHPPYGLFGGLPAAPSRNLIEDGGNWRELPAKVTLEIGRGTAIRHEQAGGGGWGDPALRDPAAVEADLGDGKITAAHAAANYGGKS